MSKDRDRTVQGKYVWQFVRRMFFLIQLLIIPKYIPVHK